MKKQETKAYGSIRKIKSYGTAGVILGFAGLSLAFGTTVQADEVTTTTPVVANTATNLTDSQEVPSSEATATIADANQAEGNIPVRIDNSTVESAVETAKKEGITVIEDPAVDKGTATNLSETEKIQAEIKVEQENQAESIRKVTEEYVAAKDEYTAETAKVVAENAKIEEENAAIKKRNEEGQAVVNAKNAEITEFNKKVEAHNKAENERVARETAEAEKNKNKEGFSKEIVVKKLLLDSEPNATIASVSGGREVSNAVAAEYEFQNAIYGNQIIKGWIEADTDSKFAFVKIGEKITVTYDNLENSSFEEQKVKKLVFAYKVLKNSKSDLTLLKFHKDPTHTLTYYENGADVQLSLEVSAYDERGTQIDLNGSAVSFSSLNAFYTQPNEYEYVSNFKGKVVEIKGSSVILHSDGKIYSSQNNVSKEKGSKFEQGEWDGDKNPNGYYGSAIGISSGKTVQFNIGAGGRNEVWFAFNTRLKSTAVIPPKYQEAKELATFTPEPEKPFTSVFPEVPKVPTVHYHGYKLFSQPSVIKSIENADMVNVNGQYVAKASLNRFVLVSETLPANRPQTTSLVFKDPLPQGFLVDVAETKKANKDYTISFDEKTNVITFSAKSSILEAVNMDLKSTYTLSSLYVWGRPQNDAADYENVFEMIVNGGIDPENSTNSGYVRKSNKVIIHTPGKQAPDTPNDPDNPNRDPLKPEKHNYNEEGELIDGKMMLPNAVNYYKADWKLRPYHNLATSKESIAKGFAYIDDYQDEAVEGLESQFMIVDAFGNEVNGLKMYHVLSQETADEAIKKMVKNSGISPIGAFYIWVAENPEEFYKAYVQKGLDISFNLPMKNKREFTGEYQNQTFQIEFGNGYYSNIVKNHVPKLEAKKDVFVNMSDTESKDGQEIKLGDKFFYYLEGSTLPANRAEKLFDYSFKDDYDEKGDKFTGEFHVRALVDIKLKDGTVIKAGQKVTEFINMVHDEKNGFITFAAKASFLEQISDDSKFGLAAFIGMERIASGKFENTIKHSVNGREVISNTVKTTTPEPPQPVKETPVVQSAGVLPRTGEKTSIFGIFGMALMGLVGFVSFKKKAED